MRHTITYEEKPLPEDIKILSNGLAEYGEDIVGTTWFKDIAFFVRNDQNEVNGGIYGNFGSFGWMYVDTLWVSPVARGKGVGRSLMESMETEALFHGCTAAFLNTFSFQAPEFYKKLGYEIFGELDKFPDGHKRLFLKKTLVQGIAADVPSAELTQT